MNYLSEDQFFQMWEDYSVLSDEALCRDYYIAHIILNYICAHEYVTFLSDLAFDLEEIITAEVMRRFKERLKK